MIALKKKQTINFYLKFLPESADKGRQSELSQSGFFMKRVRADGWLLLISLNIVGLVACKPASSGSARAPAPGASEEEDEDDTGGAAVPPATTPATTTASVPTTPTTAVPPTTITPGGGNGQPGGFIGNLISQFTNGGGLGGLTSSLGGLFNGGGLGGFDLGSLLNGLGGGLGGLNNNGFGGQSSTNSGASNGTTTNSTNQIALVSNSGDLRVDCLNAINAYRASIGRSALTLKNDATTNSCVDKQSADDGAIGAAHRNFGKCGESAQNECPGWGGETGTAQNGCLKMMWGEGPGGGHYENMANAAYRQVSCGYAQVGGKLWMIQNFYR